MPTTTPEQKLDQLNRDLADNQDTLGELTKERDSLKAEIAYVEKVVNEVKQVSGSYGQAFEEMNKKLEGVKTLAALRKKSAEALVAGKEGDLDKAVAGVEKKIKDAEDEVAQLRGGVGDAEDKARKAKDGLQAAQAAYEALKSYQKAAVGDLKEMEGLLDKIDKNENAPNNMYVLVKDLERLINDRGALQTADDLRAALYSAFDAVDAAKKACKDCDDSLNGLKAELAKKADGLADLKGRRRDLIFESVKNI